MSNPISRLLFDPVAPTRDRAPRRYQLPGESRAWLVLAGVGVAALAVSAAVGIAGSGMQRFLFAYLTAWTFCVSVALGCLFWVMIQHLTKARWSTTVRRIPEAIAANFPLLAVAGIPVLLGMHDLYHWTHPELFDPNDPAFDYLIAGKQPYLNTPFFIGRYVLYFVVWSVLARQLYARSVQSDTDPSPEHTVANRRTSAWGVVAFAITTAFAGFDFVMSADPHWFSTMFGVYFFAGGFLGAICLITFIALWLKNQGVLDTEITKDQIQDLGKFMFGFTVFWTYIAFCQYMLYAYANIPEETVWFHKRMTAGWESVSMSLIAFHFLVPFFVLILRSTKRIYPVLAIMAAWLLVMHWVDLWWMTVPATYPSYEAGHAVAGGADLFVEVVGPASDAATPDGAATFSPKVIEAQVPIVEAMAWIGLFGLMLAATFARLGRHALTPFNDPYFAEALRFRNV